jgi:hypothetical protein
VDNICHKYYNTTDLPTNVPVHISLNFWLIMTTAWSNVESWVCVFKSCNRYGYICLSWTNRHGYVSDVDQHAWICVWRGRISTDICLTWVNRHGYIYIYIYEVKTQIYVWREPIGTDVCLTWTNRHGYMSDMGQQARVYIWREKKAQTNVWSGQRHPCQACTAVRNSPFQLWHYQRPAMSMKIVSKIVAAKMGRYHEIVAANGTKQQWRSHVWFDGHIKLFSVSLLRMSIAGMIHCYVATSSMFIITTFHKTLISHSLVVCRERN